MSKKADKSLPPWEQKEPEECCKCSDVPIHQCASCFDWLCRYHWAQRLCPQAVDKSYQGHVLGWGC